MNMALSRGPNSKERNIYLQKKRELTDQELIMV